MGIFNAPTNLLASVALHLDGTVVLFQYLFGHRYHADSCAHCEEPWHPDVTDVFHRPYSARVGQWWRRSFIDSRSFITATVTPEPPAPSHVEGPAKFSTAGMKDTNDEDDDSSQRRAPSQSVQHTIRTTELPSIICELPNLSIRVQERHSGVTGSQWSNTDGSEISPVPSKHPLRSLLKRSLSSKTQPSTAQLPMPPPVMRSSLVGKAVYADSLEAPKFSGIERESVQSIQTAEEISRIPRNLTPSVSTVLPPSPKSSKQNSRKIIRNTILQNFPPTPPPPRPPRPAMEDQTMRNTNWGSLRGLTPP